MAIVESGREAADNQASAGRRGRNPVESGGGSAVSSKILALS